MNFDPEQIKDKLGIGDDKVYAVMGEFADPHDLVHAGRKIREMGYTKLDAMSPFPVHGIDDAIGIPYSKLGWIVICVALCGTPTAQLLIWWCGAINYPLVIGGKPLFDFTFSIPITFELTILFSAFASFHRHVGVQRTAAAVSSVAELPQRASRLSDDRFLLVIEANDPKFDAQQDGRASAQRRAPKRWRWWKDEEI